MQRLSKSGRQGAAIKRSPEDFIVEEITKSGKTLETGKAYDAPGVGMSESAQGRFAVFVLQKRDWNTTQALMRIAKACGRGRKSMGFAGTKDRSSVSTQLCSVFGADPEYVKKMSMKDISINGAWRSDEGVRLGDLKGNRFVVTARGAADIPAVGRIDAELGGVFPNYFGEQRFGFRNNNVEVGVSIMKGDFAAAAMSFLTNSDNETNAEAVEARKRLSEEQDFGKASEYFPKYLKYERTVLGHLSMHTTDFAGAIRKLPRQLSLMFVHAVESEIFNRTIELRIREGEGAVSPMKGETFCTADGNGWPEMGNIAVAESGTEKGYALGNILGYNTPSLSRYEREAIDSFGIEQGMFRLKGMPELSCKGAKRLLFAPYIGFESRMAEGNDGIVLSFSLPSGSYATVLLSEFFERSTGTNAGSSPVE